MKPTRFETAIVLFGWASKLPRPKKIATSKLDSLN